MGAKYLISSKEFQSMGANCLLCSKTFLKLMDEITPIDLNSFVESNLIGEDHRVTHVSLAIEVDNSNLRTQSRLKNNNKSPRLSSIPR